MSKIAKKMVFPISIFILIITMISILLNSFFIQKYSLYQRKRKLEEISKKVLTIIQENQDKQRKILEKFSVLEQTYNITIVTFPNLTEENAFNDELRNQLQKRNIGFTKLWLWQDNYKKLQKDKTIIKIYKQERLQYSILVKYLIFQDQVYVISMNVPHIEETIHIINFFTICIFGLGEIVIIFLIIFLVKKVTTPLTKLNLLAKDIARLSFQKADIHTKDEIEDLADSFNKMSENLETAQKELEEKNKSMENLVANVSHEMKTPLALIKVYTNGIKDGIDDGSFLDVILEQAEKANKIVETLLHLSSIKKGSLNLSKFDFSKFIKEIVKEYKILFDTKEISFSMEIEDSIFLCADKEEIKIVIINLLTNAIKYGEKFIQLSLKRKDKQILFEISNGISKDFNLIEKNIWEPFYVGEKSRNKELSGTGLGLSIVKEILKQHDFIYGCKIENKKIIFYFNLIKEIPLLKRKER